MISKVPPTVGEQDIKHLWFDPRRVKFLVYDFQPVEYHRSVESKKRFTKTTLPEKICIRCKRPFSWRKRWEKVWAEVKYCSERCRNEKARA